MNFNCSSLIPQLQCIIFKDLITDEIVSTIDLFPAMVAMERIERVKAIAVDEPGMSDKYYLNSLCVLYMCFRIVSFWHFWYFLTFLATFAKLICCLCFI